MTTRNIWHAPSLMQRAGIRRVAAVLLLTLLTTVTAWADNVTLSVDNDIAEGTAGHYYVNMPAEYMNTLTLTDASITTFKVYDDGGKTGNYSNGCNSNLVINAPEGYRINLAGSIKIHPDDFFYIKEGSYPESGTELVSEGGIKNINVTSEGGSVIFQLNTNGDVNRDSYTGLDITVTLIDNHDYNITVANVSNGSVAASVNNTGVTTAKKGTAVTLTATPDEGYLLADLSVTSGGEAVALTWDVWTNSATFTMPATEVTVTPTFTSNKTATGDDALFAIIPKSGTRTLTIPEGVTSFKVYDDGGPNGNYSPNCDGWLELNLPAGYHFLFSGTLTTDANYNDRLGFYKWNFTNPTQFPKSETAGVPFNFTYNFDESIRLRFKSDSENQYAGVDLTVTLVDASHSVTVNNANNVNGSVVTASVGGTSVTKATTGQTVTLTAAPANGYVLGALSVRDADGKVVDVTDMLWYTNTNTATFTMPNSDVTITPVFTNVMTAEGGLTVNMPMKTNSLWGRKDVTIPSGVTSFKVYDYGGPDCNYSEGYGGMLNLTAPDDCVLQLSGTVTTKAGGATTFTVYDGTDSERDDYLVNNVYSATDGAEVTIPAVVSTSESVYLAFSTDDGDNYASLDLTVTVISPGTDYSVTVSNGDTRKGTMTASTTTAQLGTEVTLTATPAAGYMLSGLSVTCGGRAVKTNWNVWTNSATFKMPNGDVTVTPTFTNDLGSLAVCLPVQGNKNVTIPEGVASFKIYDDGGPDGNYTPYSYGNVYMTAAEGSQLRITGSVTGPEDKFNMTIDNTTFTATTTDIDITSTASNPRVGLKTLYGDTGAGLDLTATVLYAVGVATGISNGSVTINGDKTHAAADETITLTVEPDDGYSIGTVKYNDGSDHMISAVNGVYSFKMPAKNVSVTATFRKLLTSDDITVADIPAQEYAGTALMPVVTIKDGETPLTENTDFSISTTTDCINADNYEVTITGIGNYDGTATKTFTITPKDLTIKAKPKTISYGDAPANDGVTYSGFVNGEGASVLSGTLTYAYKTATDDTGEDYTTSSPVGTYYIIPGGLTATNYDITFAAGTLTVGKADYYQPAQIPDITKYVPSDKAGSFTIALPALPTGATYSFTKTDESGVIDSHSYDAEHNTLTYTTNSGKAAGTRAAITVEAKGAPNYNDYSFTVSAIVSEYTTAYAWPEQTSIWLDADNELAWSAAGVTLDRSKLTVKKGSATVTDYTAKVGDTELTDGENTLALEPGAYRIAITGDNGKLDDWVNFKVIQLTEDDDVFSVNVDDCTWPLVGGSGGNAADTPPTNTAVLSFNGQEELTYSTDNDLNEFLAAHPGLKLWFEDNDHTPGNAYVSRIFTLNGLSEGDFYNMPEPVLEYRGLDYLGNLGSIVAAGSDDQRVFLPHGMNLKQLKDDDDQPVPASSEGGTIYYLCVDPPALHYVETEGANGTEWALYNGNTLVPKNHYFRDSENNVYYGNGSAYTHYNADSENGNFISFTPISYVVHGGPGNWNMDNIKVDPDNEYKFSYYCYFKWQNCDLDGDYFELVGKDFVILDGGVFFYTGDIVPEVVDGNKIRIGDSFIRSVDKDSNPDHTPIVWLRNATIADLVGEERNCPHAYAKNKVDDYHYQVASCSFLIYPNNSLVEIRELASVSKVGEDVTCNVILHGPKTGAANVFLNGELYTHLEGTKTHEVKFTGLHEGTYAIDVFLDGDDYVTPDHTNASFTMVKNDPVLTITGTTPAGGTIEYDPDASELPEFQYDPENPVIITVANDAAVSGTSWKWTISNTDVVTQDHIVNENAVNRESIYLNTVGLGEVTVTARFSGNYKYNSSTISTRFKVVPLMTTLFAANTTNQWMTWCNAYAWTLPEGCNAYTINSVSGTTVTLNEVTAEGNASVIIPAYTPVLIQRETIGDDAVKAEFSAVGTVPETGYNSETGLVTSTGTDDTDVVFYGNSGNDAITTGYYTAGQTYGLYNNVFVRIDSDSDNGLAAHRCVLKVSGSNARQLSIGIGDESTGISEELRVKSEEFAAATGWYSLDGRKIDGKPTKKGLYIHNGVKTVIK